MRSRKPQPDPTTGYARAVVAGEILAGRPVRLACERQLRDLKDGAARGLSFDLDAAERAIRFFSYLQLAEGEFAGKPFTLLPFQQFIIGSLFGWMGPDGFRRFRTAFIEIGKGNCKTKTAAGIGLYCLVADHEEGAEIYSAATTREQARIAWADADKMVAASPFLARSVARNVSNLAVLATNSYFRPVSSEGRGLDGKRVHCAILDEIHEHPSPIVVDKMRAGTKQRRQALIFEITNSGFNRETVCWYHHEYSIKVLEGLIENDNWFAYVCSLDPCTACIAEGNDTPTEGCPECDDWRDERVWLKANPALDVAIPRKYLREQVAEAIGMPSKMNIVKRLNFCCWTSSEVRWLPMDDWDLCGAPFDPQQLRGQECYGGLDLATTSDLAAFVLVFPNEDPPKVLAYFWLPEKTVRERSQNQMVPYDVWVRQELIEPTPGDVTDYDVIRERIKELAEEFVIKEIGYDPYNAMQLVTQLESDGLKMIPVRQGMMSMSPPSKHLEVAVRSHAIRHGGNPVLRWCASNAAAVRDSNDNVRPDKQRSSEKIDGITALVIALSRMIVQEEPPPSVYETRGIDFIGGPERCANSRCPRPPALGDMYCCASCRTSSEAGKPATHTEACEGRTPSEPDPNDPEQLKVAEFLRLQMMRRRGLL
jgi:phage terminase large subunit-like protein